MKTIKDISRLSSITRYGYSIVIPKDTPVIETENGYTFSYGENHGKLNKEGKIHCEDGPAAVIDGSIFYAKDGLVHREDGPAIIRGDEYRYLVDGYSHRVDGPSLVWGGREEWHFNGNFHREGGPAVTHSDGTMIWYHHGKIHNSSGYAIIHSNGVKEFFLSGKPVTKGLKKWCKKHKINLDNIDEGDILVYQFETNMGA